MTDEAAARRVLVTGPVQSLEDYAQAARAAGWEALAWPLLTIEQLEVDLVALIDGLPDWICITSANALAALGRAAQSMPELLTAPFACVGERSAERARSLGFKTALHAAADADALARELLEALAPASTVLWPRGSRSRELGESLEGAGHTVLGPVVYETRAGSAGPPDGARAAVAVLFASPSAVAAYLEREPGAVPRAAIAIGATTTRALEDHRGRFDAILTLERPAPEAFTELLSQLPSRP